MAHKFKLPKLTERQLEQRYRRFKKNLPELKRRLETLEKAKRVPWETMQIEFNI